MFLLKSSIPSEPHSVGEGSSVKTVVPAKSIVKLKSEGWSGYKKK